MKKAKRGTIDRLVEWLALHQEKDPEQYGAVLEEIKSNPDKYGPKNAERNKNIITLVKDRLPQVFYQLHPEKQKEWLAEISGPRPKHRGFGFQGTIPMDFQKENS